MFSRSRVKAQKLKSQEYLHCLFDIEELLK